MSVSEATQLKALLNMDMAGSVGPFPDAATPIDDAALRGFIGLYPFVPPTPASTLEIIQAKYFEAPSDARASKSLASELPDGEAWQGKSLQGKFMYALVFSTAGCLNLYRTLVEVIAQEMDITQTNLLLPEWEESVGLPDSRLELTNLTVQDRRNNIIQRLKKEPTVTLVEMQLLIDDVLPDSGIFLTLDKTLSGFNYDFQYGFGPVGVRQKFTIIVNTPEFALDQISWENLLSWLKDFGQSGVLWVQNIIPSATSYVVITSPASFNTIYAIQDVGGLWGFVDVRWKAIDKNNTVSNNRDIQTIDNFIDQITRIFLDSDSNLIEGISIPNIVVL